jgi:hypothetical protein
MRLRALLGSAVLSAACMLVNVHGAGASPTVAQLNAWRLEAVWDAGDGTPVLALLVYQGTFDLGSGPQSFTWSSIVLPTDDGTQTSCGTVGAPEVDASPKAATLSATYTCADGRSVAVDVEWTASGAPQGSGSGLHRRGEGPAGSSSGVDNDSATAAGSISDVTGNLLDGPSTRALIGRERTKQLCGMGSIAC